MKKSDPMLEKIEAFNEAQGVESSFGRLERVIPFLLSRTVRRLPGCVPQVMEVRLRFCGGVIEIGGSQSVSLVV